MIHRARYLLWGGAYMLRTWASRGGAPPFIGGMVLNESCNLRCSHCRVASRDQISDHRFAEVIDGLARFRKLGIRSVFLEGGEPFLWRDGVRKIEDVVVAARRIGFLTVSIYTNGTLPIRTTADTVFVSLDGMSETNNMLRGPVFDKVIDRVNASSHRNMLINYTINAKNVQDVEAMARFVAQQPKLRGVFYYFYTPYYGRDDLFLTREQRLPIIDQLVGLKRRGLPIINSYTALDALAKDDWPRPTDLCYVWADRKMYQCCRARGNDEVCRECGYLGYLEVQQIVRLRPGALWDALRYIPLSIARKT